MNFSSINDNAYSYEQACSVLRKWGLCPSTVKNAIVRVKEVEAPPGLTTAVALRVFHALGQAAMRREKHPVDRLDELMLQSDMFLETTKVTVVIEDQPIVLSQSRGYMVEDVHGMEPIMAQAADAMSYVYTPSSSEPSSSLISNFATTTADAALPTIRQQAPLNDNWIVAGGIANSRSTFQNLVDDRSSTFLAHKAVVQLLEEAVPKSKNKETSMFIAAPGNVPTSVEARQGVLSRVKVARPFIPSVQPAGSIDVAWRYLSRHRMARGEDQKWISPLTSGYYYCSMTRAMDKLLWNVADIMHIAQKHAVSSIYFVAPPSMTVAHSLVMNGYAVFMRTDSMQINNPQFRQDGTFDPAIYMVKDPDEWETPTLTVYPPDASTRPVIKKARDNSKTMEVEYAPAHEYYRDIAESVSHHVGDPFMYHAFLTPHLIDNFADNLEPSIHAHSGHVIVHGPCTAASVTVEQLVTRFMRANVFKTWFPLSRTRFLEYDLTVLKWTNTALPSMMLSVMPRKEKKRGEDFGREVSLDTPEFKRVLAVPTVVFGSLWQAKAKDVPRPELTPTPVPRLQAKAPIQRPQAPPDTQYIVDEPIQIATGLTSETLGLVPRLTTQRQDIIPPQVAISQTTETPPVQVVAPSDSPALQQQPTLAPAKEIPEVVDFGDVDVF